MKFAVEMNNGTKSSYPLEGAISFDWMPSPHVSYSAWSDSDDGAIAFAKLSAAKSDIQPDTAIWLPPPSAVATASKSAESTFSGTLDQLPFDATGRMESAIAYVVNFLKFDRGFDSSHPSGRPGLQLTTPTHYIDLVEVDGLRDIVAELKANGGYAFTHTATIQRRDDKTMTEREVGRVFGSLHQGLSFARGSRCGIALPVGRGGGQVVWAEYSCMRTDEWRGGFHWIDTLHAEQLVAFFESYATASTDDYVESVVGSAINYYLTGNIPKPLEVAIAMSQAGLELLAWSHLVGKKLLNEDEAEKLRAASRIRLLAHDAGIPFAVPDEYDEMSALPGVEDGLAAIAKVRNNFIHPNPTRQPFDYQARIQAWLMGQWLLELLILNKVGYSGTYASRLVEGRWVGSVEDVPWVK